MFIQAVLATDCSIMNTGRAMRWLPMSRVEKSKAKQAVDTFFMRIGDLVASVTFLVGTLSFKPRRSLLRIGRAPGKA